jgi:hypothetical protein
MWIVRESRREEAPALPHVEDDGGWFVCFLVMGASGNIMVDDAGLEAMALEDTELLSGLSHGALLWRRREAGLIWDAAEDDMLRAEEDVEAIRIDAGREVGSCVYAR